MDGVPRWRIGRDVRSADVGAGAALDQVVDFDDRPPPAVPGSVDVLSTWLWQNTAGVRTLTVTIHATISTARTIEKRVQEEEVDLHAIPGSASPFIVPVRALAYARSEERLTIEWSSGSAPLAHVTVAVTESVGIGLFEHRPPLTGPDATGDPIVRERRHVVVEVGELPDSLPVLDRYSGEYLPEGNDHPETAPIKPFIYAPDRPNAPST